MLQGQRYTSRLADEESGTHHKEKIQKFCFNQTGFFSPLNKAPNIKEVKSVLNFEICVECF